MSAAHIAGLPVEELAHLAPVAGALWLALRARFALSPRRRPARAAGASGGDGRG